MDPSCAQTVEKSNHCWKELQLMQVFSLSLVFLIRYIPENKTVWYFPRQLCETCICIKAIASLLFSSGERARAWWWLGVGEKKTFRKMNNFMNVEDDKWEVDVECGFVVQCWTNAKPFKSLPACLPSKGGKSVELFTMLLLYLFLSSRDLHDKPLLFVQYWGLSSTLNLGKSGIIERNVVWWGGGNEKS